MEVERSAGRALAKPASRDSRHDKGVYLVEATNGTLRAYTIVVVTDIAIITKAAPGRLLCYVVDRTSGNPIAGATTRVWIDQQEIANKPTDAQGIA